MVQGQNEGMKRTLLFVLALAVIPVGVDAQAPDRRTRIVLIARDLDGAGLNAALDAAIGG